MQRDGRIGPLLVGPPRRQRVAVQRPRARKVSCQTREPGQVHQVGGGDVIPPVAPIERQGGLELAPRLVHVSHRLRQQAEVVPVGGGAATVPDPLPQRQRPRDALARRPEIAAVFADACERQNRVGLDPHVPDAHGQPARLREVRPGAVEPPLLEEGRADVAQHRPHAGRVAVRRRSAIGAPPGRNGGSRAVPSVRRDARPPHAVGPQLRRTPLCRPRREPRHFAHQERITPPRRIGDGQPPGGGEILPRHRLRDSLAGRERARPRFEHQLRFGQTQGQEAKRIRRRRLAEESEENQRGRVPAIENSTRSDAAHRSNPVRASTFQR